MRYGSPFQADDLEELDEMFYAKAARVVAMEDVALDGVREANVIGLRHDCDAGHSLATAVSMAHWEAERGYRSTYFLLHTSPYWNYTAFPNMVQQIAECGHEIGIHTDALAESLVTGEDPDLILERAIGRLRDLGYPVRGVVGHGNAICLRNRQPHESPFANDEHFVECRRPDHGEANRIITRGDIRLRLAPRPLADFGLEYEALWSGLPFHWRCSDSSGKWLNPGFEETASLFDLHSSVAKAPSTAIEPRQLHLLIHPDWWSEAFSPTAVAAVA